VDLGRCRERAGCEACRAACHAAHNVPEIADPAHEVKWIWKEPFERVFPGTPRLDASLRDLPVPVLCNHCDDPPCVRVCPTGATFSREDGAVTVDEHRCIGCRYCMAACPYGARSFNFQDPKPLLAEVRPDYPTRVRGVVEKCTLCAERLDAGRPPACVEACPAGALRFGDVADPPVSGVVSSPLTLRRRPELGTSPHVFYVL
jgi:molybdopterin-containing oxidoreductase family iron-sulfur binding subunit